MFIKIEGFGVETFAGTVPFADYKYFESEGIELSEYNDFLHDFNGESTLSIPEEHNFALERGSSLIDIDDLWGMQGAFLNENNRLIVESDEGEEWECDCSLSTLQSHGIKLVAVSDAKKIIEELPSPTAIVVSTQVISGTIFGDDDVSPDTEFDPKQLEIHYHNSGTDLVVKSIKYAENELSNIWIDAEIESTDYEWIEK